jgi:hypothetical protein
VPASWSHPPSAHPSHELDHIGVVTLGGVDLRFEVDGGSGVRYRRPECRGAAEKSLILTRTASEAHREAGLAAIDALADRLSATRLEDLVLRAHIPVVPLVGTTRGSRYEMADVLPSTKGHTKAALRTWRGRKSS